VQLLITNASQGLQYVRVKERNFLSYCLFWVNPRRLNFTCRHFGTDRLSEMVTHKIQTRGNQPKETIRHPEHGESLKSIMASPSVENVARHGIY